MHLSGVTVTPEQEAVLTSVRSGNQDNHVVRHCVRESKERSLQGRSDVESLKLALAILIERVSFARSVSVDKGGLNPV